MHGKPPAQVFFQPYRRGRRNQFRDRLERLDRRALALPHVGAKGLLIRGVCFLLLLGERGPSRCLVVQLQSHLGRLPSSGRPTPSAEGDAKTIFPLPPKSDSADATWSTINWRYKTEFWTPRRLDFQNAGPPLGSGRGRLRHVTGAADLVLFIRPLWRCARISRDEFSYNWGCAPRLKPRNRLAMPRSSRNFSPARFARYFPSSHVKEFPVYRN